MLNFTRTPRAELLSHMVDDLKFAVDNLPVNPDAVKPGKLTKWAALHLLAEVYLCQKDYENARKCARQVIDSGYFSLMKERFGAEKGKNPATTSTTSLSRTIRTAQAAIRRASG